MQYLGCNESKESQNLLCPLTVFMKRKTEYNADEENTVTLHGSLLMQHMLKFNKPIKVIDVTFDSFGSQVFMRKIVKLNYQNSQHMFLFMNYMYLLFIIEKNMSKMF